MKLFCRTAGKGSPLVILHGLYGSSDNWMSVARNLAPEFLVYSVDLRNHGHSFHHPLHTYRAMKEDLHSFFEEHQIEKAVLLGHSMGGKVAILFAADYPERVRKLIVTDIAPKNYMENEEESQFFFHRNILSAMKETDLSRLKDRKQVGDRLAERIDGERLIQFLMKNLYFDRLSKQMKWRLNIDALYDHLDEIVEGVNIRWLEDRIPIVSYPVSFIRGLKSPYIKDSDIPLIREVYPEAVVHDIPGAGHWLHAEKPKLFMEAVLKCC